MRYADAREDQIVRRIDKPKVVGKIVRLSPTTGKILVRIGDNISAAYWRPAHWEKVNDVSAHALFSQFARRNFP
jgi:hypothetical protein